MPGSDPLQGEGRGEQPLPAAQGPGAPARPGVRALGTASAQPWQVQAEKRWGEPPVQWAGVVGMTFLLKPQQTDTAELRAVGSAGKS